MKLGQPYAMPMPRLVCRLFAAQSVSLALSFQAYAVETLRALTCRTITPGVKNQRLAESWTNYTMETVVSVELARRQGLANTVGTSPWQAIQTSLCCLNRWKMPNAAHFSCITLSLPICRKSSLRHENF
jgi:hypothetical protein